MKKVIVAIATICLTLPVSVFGMTLGGIQFGTGDYDGVICMPFNCAGAGENMVYFYDTTQDILYTGQDCADGEHPHGGQGEQAGLVGVCNNGIGGGFAFTIGNSYSIIEHNTSENLCELENYNLPYADCKALPAFYGEGTFIYSGVPPEVSSFITLPESAGTDLFASLGQLVSDLWVLIALAIAAPLAFYAIQKIIDLIAK